MSLLGAGALAASVVTLADDAPAGAGKGGKKRNKKKNGKGGKGGKGGPGTVVTTPPPPPPPSVEAQLLGLINEHRGSLGLAPLKWDDELGTAAQGHSDDMVARNYFSQNPPSPPNIGDRMRSAGYPQAQKWGANLFESSRGDPSVREAFEFWKNTAGRNANMVNTQHTRVGLGQATKANGVTLWTGIFAGHPLDAT